MSPQHRFLLANPSTALYTGQNEVLVPARQMLGRAGVTQRTDLCPTYVHIAFDMHELVLVDGCWSESYQPGLSTLAGCDAATRDELVQLFPDLLRGARPMMAARQSSKSFEARVLLQG